MRKILAEIEKLECKIAVTYEKYKKEHPGTKKKPSDKLFSSDDVIAHHKSHTTAEIQPHVEQLIKSHPKRKKVKEPVSDLALRHTMESLVDKYKDMSSPAPSIILHPNRYKNEDTAKYEILDGAHRTEAARQRGDDEIEAFIQ